MSKVSSEMRTEVDHLRAQMRQEMRALATEVDNRRDLLRHEAELFNTSKQLASAKDWVMCGSDAKYSCGVCTRHSSHFRHPSQRNSKWIIGNGGFKYSSRLSVEVCKHETSEMHGIALELEDERSHDPLHFSLQHQLAESRSITAKLFRTVYDNTLHFRAFLDYENIVHLQHHNDFEVGDQLHSRNTAPTMLRVIYHTDRSAFIHHFTTIDPATGRLPLVGVAADKVSDKRMKQWQCNAGRSRCKGSPFTFCSELLKMGTTAKGVDCFKNMIDSCTGIGIRQASQRKTYCFDGEAVYSGAGTTADTCKSLVKSEDPRDELKSSKTHHTLESF